MNHRLRLQNYLTPAKRKHLSKFWFAGTLVYDGIRALIVSKTFSKYGINGHYYFGFELFISVFFSMASLRLVLALVDGKSKKATIFSVLTGLLFFAPEIYIITAGNHIPSGTFVILGVYLTITFTISILLVLNDVRKKRKEAKKITEQVLHDSFEDD